MTYSEYDSLRVGDVVYYINIRYLQMTIEPMRVAEVNKVPYQSIWVSKEGMDNLLRVDFASFDLFFTSLSEASKRLGELTTHNDRRRREEYALARPNEKSQYIYSLITI